MKLQVNGKEIEIEELQSIVLAKNEFLFIRHNYNNPSHAWVGEFFGDFARQVILHSDPLEFAKVRFENRKNLKDLNESIL